MKAFLIVFIALFSISLQAQFNSDNLELAEEHQIASHSTHNKLKVYPIRASETFRKEYKDLGDFLSLEEAIKRKKIKISEVNRSGEVNSLQAENKSDKPILIMAGEVVQGGKQDRIIAVDVVIAAGETKNLDAFCVEQGRWATKESGTSFIGYMNVSSKGVRKAAVVDKEQSRVWSNVAEVVVKNNADSDTGTYSQLQRSESYNKELEVYLSRFKSVWNNDPTVVGVVAVTGDEIIGCDIFASHQLFVNAYDNLIHSYITEAITNGEKVTVTRVQIQKYLDQFLKDESKQEKNLEGKGSLFEYKGRKLHIAKF